MPRSAPCLTPTRGASTRPHGLRDHRAIWCLVGEDRRRRGHRTVRQPRGGEHMGAQLHRTRRAPPAPAPQTSAVQVDRDAASCGVRRRQKFRRLNFCEAPKVNTCALLSGRSEGGKSVHVFAFEMSSAAPPRCAFRGTVGSHSPTAPTHQGPRSPCGAAFCARPRQARQRSTERSHGRSLPTSRPRPA